jgi:hypothetical protein
MPNVDAARIGHVIDAVLESRTHEGVGHLAGVARPMRKRPA